MKRSHTLWIAFLSFIGLGLFDGILGVAWPSMRATFGVSLGSLGWLLLPFVAGYILTSSNSGWLIRRFSLPNILMLGVTLRMLAMAGEALTPVWGGMIAAALVNGLGAGVVDAGLNTFVATRHTARQMNWLHAFFGVGSTLGPVVMTALLVAQLSWRWAFAAGALLQLILLLLFARTRSAWSGVAGELDDTEDSQAAPYRETLRLPVAWLGILLFFLYAGTEVSTGQWSFTLLTEGRGIDAQTAGFWVSMYWGSFTVGRFLTGIIADRLRTVTLLRASMIGMLVGLGLLWWNPLPAVGLFSLALSGFAMAAVFPTLVSDTPRRLGPRHAPNAIGLQIGAAGLGVGLLTSGVGWVAERWGLESTGPLLFGGALLLWLLFEWMRALSARRRAAA